MDNNPYQSPVNSDDKSEFRPTNSPVLTAFKVAVLVWICLISIASLGGGFLSLFTGHASELPEWNGVSYMFFCAKEGAMFAIVLGWPVAVVVFAICWVARYFAK